MASIGTFSAVQENIAKFEEKSQTETTPTETTPEQTAQPEQSTETPVQGNSNPTETPMQEENVSDFSLNFNSEEAPNPAPTETPTQQPTFNWKEEIKKIDRKELLKEVGVNDFAVEINEYLSKGGKASDYLNAKSIDYNQVSDEEIIKSDLRKQYPTFTSQQIDLFFTRKYMVGEDALDEDKEFATLQLKADAHNARQQKIQEQQKFVIPDTPILPKDEAYENWKKQQEYQPQLMEQLRTYYGSHEATKTLNESKRVAINLGEGVAPFNFQVDRPELLTQMFTDGGELWNKVTSTKTGEPDVQKQQLIALFSFDPMRAFQQVFNYGKSMGKREQVAEGQNAQRPQAKVLAPEFTQTASYSTGKFGDKQR